MKSSFLSFGFITLFLFTIPAPAADIADDVLAYTNSFRKSNGKAALIMKEDLNAIAQKHSENMAKGRTKFGHEGFNKRYNEAKKKYDDFNSFAENVGYGVKTGKDAVDMWKASSGHRQNMLGNYRYIGIGVAKDRSGMIYYTQVFVN
jgi:uncharacterized protein YkwD